MAISSRRRDADMQIDASGVADSGRWQRVFGGVAGRLSPLALDNAHRKLDATLYSVTVGGLTQEQIDAAQLAGSSVLERVRAAIETLIARRR